MKIEFELKPLILTKPLIFLLAILSIIFPMSHIKYYHPLYGYLEGTIYILPFLIIFMIGISMNLCYIKNQKTLRSLGIFGMGLTILGFLGNLILTILSYITLSDVYIVVLKFQLSLYSAIVMIGLMVIEIYWNYLIIKKQDIKLKLKEELPSEKILKLTENGNKGDIAGKIAKKGMKGLSKSLGKMAGEMAGEMVGEIAGDIVDDKLTVLTENEVLGDMAGKIAKKGIKGLSKSLGKMAGEMVGDAMTDITGDEELGDMAGKLAKKGVSKLTEKGLSPSKTEGIKDQPIEINHKKRLLGILKAKKQVEIEYIEKILKLPHDDVIGMIYELIGKGKIEGEFNDDDTIYTVMIDN